MMQFVSLLTESDNNDHMQGDCNKSDSFFNYLKKKMFFSFQGFEQTPLNMSNW